MYSVTYISLSTTKCQDVESQRGDVQRDTTSQWETAFDNPFREDERVMPDLSIERVQAMEGLARATTTITTKRTTEHAAPMTKGNVSHCLCRILCACGIAAQSTCYGTSDDEPMARPSSGSKWVNHEDRQQLVVSKKPANQRFESSGSISDDHDKYSAPRGAYWV